MRRISLAAALAAFGAFVPVGLQAQSADTAVLNTDRIDAYINKYGSREATVKSVRAIEKVNLFLEEEPKDDLAKLRKALSIIQTLFELSDTPEGEAAAQMLSMVQSFLPDKPDLYMFHLTQIEEALNALNEDMRRGFERLAAQEERNTLDSMAFDHINQIDQDYGTYIDFLKNVRLSEEQGLSDVFMTDMLQIKGGELTGASEALAKLCGGTELFDMQNIFDAHLRETDGDVMGALAIGQYLLHKIVFAQQTHSGRIFYDDNNNSVDAIKNAMEIADARHQEHFEACNSVLDRLMKDLNSRDEATLRRFIVPFLRNWDGSMRASVLGKELKARMPMLEWTIVTYEHAPNSGDKSGKNWEGDKYIKIKIDPVDRSLEDHWVIVSWHRTTERVLTDPSNCAGKIDAFNARNFKVFQDTGIFGGRRRDFLTMLCPDIDETTYFAWASKRTGATVWTSDPLSVKATTGDSLKRRTDTYVKYLVVGRENASCSRQQPDFAKIAGIGGSSNRALFVDQSGRFFEYTKSRSGSDNCFRTRAQALSLNLGPDVDDIGIAGILDTDWNGSGADRPGEGWSANFILLKDGTYRTTSTNYASEFSEVRVGEISERFSGITEAQAKMIVGATAVPSLENLYFFFSDGTYSRYNIPKARVDFGPHPIDQGWSGVDPKGIIGVAEFEETNDAIYFFYEDGQYARYLLSQRRQDLIREAKANWR